LSSLHRFPLDVRIWNALLAYVDYLGKMAYPVGLAAFYPHPGSTVAVVPALGAGLLLVAITVLVLGPGRRRRYLAVGWLWYLGTLVPVIGLVQVLTYRIADRYSYVPLIGLFLALTWGVSDWAAARRWPRLALIATTMVVLSICVVRTRVQLGYWKNDRDLWEHAASVTEKNAMAHNFLGIDYAKDGLVHSAEQEFRKAVAFDPEAHRFHFNLATQLQELGRDEEAVVECRQAAALQPAAARYHFMLGELLRDLGREDEALAKYQQAIRLDPVSAVAHTRLANLLVDMGRHSEAMAEYHKALELQPDYPAAHVGLGNFFATLGKREEALTEFRRAIDLDPRRPVPHLNAGKVLQELGRLDEAMQEYGRAFRLGYQPAGNHLRRCERLRGLLPRLPDLIAERERPETNAERLAFATLCRQPFVGRYVLAVRLYTAAFRTDPGLRDDARTALRYVAAVAAAQAGCGQGRDAGGLDSREKAQLRQQALAWLQAEIRDWAKLLQRNSPSDRAAVRQALRVWQRDIRLQGVREAGALIQLPEGEREAWQKLWQDVEKIRAMASPSV
jgi:tetratricopeptide (TPR) repeat protein